MQETSDQIITPEVRMVIYLMVICVVMLYILSIIYVIAMPSASWRRTPADKSFLLFPSWPVTLFRVQAANLIDRESRPDIALSYNSATGLALFCVRPIAMILSCSTRNTQLKRLPKYAIVHRMQTGRFFALTAVLAFNNVWFCSL